MKHFDFTTDFILHYSSRTALSLYKALSPCVSVCERYVDPYSRSPPHTKLSLYAANIVLLRSVTAFPRSGAHLREPSMSLQSQC